MINWNYSKAEAEIIALIARRAVQELNVEFVQVEMDIAACHCNGCPLRLEELLNASKFDFAHDVLGIRENIDRETGELKNCFWPRYADDRKADHAYNKAMRREYGRY